MPLVQPKLIFFDSAHWAQWLDSALSNDQQRRQEARDFYDALLQNGSVPVLSWHHIEELIGIEDGSNAKDRIAYIQHLPFVSWMRLPHERDGIAGVTDLLAAELTAFLDGFCDLGELRKKVRARIVRSGPGSGAIGSDVGIWPIMRNFIRSDKERISSITALQEFGPFANDNLTFGEICNHGRKPPGEMIKALASIGAIAKSELMRAGDLDEAAANRYRDEFVLRVFNELPQGSDTRTVLTNLLINYGLDPSDIRDERKLSELLELSRFKMQVRAVAEKTKYSLSDLLVVPQKCLPSQLVQEALRRHGQKRPKRPASDLNDRYLVSFAPYVDRIYVDRRTMEDVRRSRQKSDVYEALFVNVDQKRRYTDLIE